MHLNPDAPEAAEEAPQTVEERKHGDENERNLILSIKESVMIHNELFHRMLECSPRPSLTLAELLEAAADRYHGFSDLVRQASCRFRD